MAGRGVNKVILIGNLGSDPELRTTTGGASVASFTLATNESWTDRDGAKQERTEWHRIVAWAKLAEICGQYLSKGRQVYIEGRLTTRTWTDKNNIERKTTEIIARDMQMLGSRGDGAPRPSGGGGGGGQAETPEFAAETVKIDDAALPF